MWYISAVTALATLLAGTAGEAALKHATGTFEVRMVPAAQDSVDGLGLARLAMTKTFTGDLDAGSSGDMLTAAGPVAGSAAYVLIERVTGTLSGRMGSFALMHSATMDRGKPDQHIVVVPDSGTGALVGLSGAMTIRVDGGKHFYDLAYDVTPVPVPAAK